MKHIGILAHSADGAALCFLEMIRKSAHLLSEHQHPEITLSILPMRDALVFYSSSDLFGVNATLIRSARRLAAAECDFFVCPDNTAHLALDAASEPFPLPGLHICRIVAKRGMADGHRRVGLLGTLWTMEGAAYARALAAAGLELRTPSTVDMLTVNRIIIDELCQGVISQSSKAHLLRIIAGFAEAACDAVVLGCTELPLLISTEESPLPILDSTRLLAQEAVRVALGFAAVPVWRGGPE